MCTTTMMIDKTAMATTKVTRPACYHITWAQQDEFRVEGQQLRMNWVVVTDEKGRRKLRMCWQRPNAVLQP